MLDVRVGSGRWEDADLFVMCHDTRTASPERSAI